VSVCVRALTVAIFQFLTDFDEIWHRRLEPETKNPFVETKEPFR